DRIIKLIIEDKKDISSMIIVTFTNKASIEMKTRIKDELNNILKSDYPDKKFIVEQIGKLKNAHIQTMHAFCADMIRENFYYFKNLSPKFTIITQNQESVLKKDSIDQLFEREYESMDVEFKLFLDNFSNLRDDLPARKAILKTYNLVQSQLYPIEWLKNKTEKKIDLYVFKEIIKEKLENLKESIEDLLSRMQGKKGIHKFKVRVKFFEFVNDDLIKISKLYSLVDENWDDFVSKISSLKFDGRIAKSKEDDEFDLNIIKEVRNEYKEQLKTLQLDLINKSSEILNRNNYLESRILCKLSELTSDFNKIYSLKKMEQNCLDFNDLEHFFIKLLDNEQVLKELVEKFEYIYFDEYQDSNLIQNHIINKLKRNNNLFLVGDLKQSIYRFRLAKPDLFLQKLKEYEKDSQSRRINLNENFRTEKNLIEFNNYIFDRLMTLENSSIDYKNGGHRLNWTVDNSKKYNDIASVELDLIQDDGYEYDFISKRIIELKSKGAQYRDIAILLRSSTNLYKLRNSLEKYEIPYYSDMDSSSFENVEINFFISLLKL
ncbi:MAG: UvrD-helicase domain-containing protein, partial [Helcococcus sp.]|nr:UvrD-helicase domain-containing protein [Helcococcus sp.]